MASTSFAGMFFLLACVAVAAAAVPSSTTPKVAGEIEKEPAFSTLIQRIAVDAENSTLYHRLYVGIGLGTLPLEKFKVLVQQDDIYVVNYLRFFGELAKQESDPERKKYLQSIEEEAPFWDAVFNEYYAAYGFNRTEFVSPSTAAYNRLHNELASSAHISESLAAALPCFTIWHKMGYIWADLANKSTNSDLDNHPYKLWITNNAPSSSSNYTAKFLAFVDGYYERLGDGNDTAAAGAKQRMIDAYRRGAEAEQYFADGAFETAFEEKFSLQVESLPATAYAVRKTVYHPLYVELAKDTLPLDTFRTLIQQDDLYMRGFYKVFELLAAKEVDPSLQKRLTKKNSSIADMFGFFQHYYEKFGFHATDVALPTTAAYINFTLEAATDAGLNHTRTVGEGLASVYACYLIWDKMGTAAGQIADFDRNPGHRFRHFVEYNDPARSGHGQASTSFRRMSELIDGYYERLGNEGGVNGVQMKRRMIETYKKAVTHEYDFATGIFAAGGAAAARESASERASEFSVI